jgi:hypothetical protein
MEWIKLIQNTAQLLIFVNMVMNSWPLYKGVKFSDQLNNS